MEQAALNDDDLFRSCGIM